MAFLRLILRPLMPPHLLISLAKTVKKSAYSGWSTPRRFRPAESIDMSEMVIELGVTPGLLELRFGSAFDGVQKTSSLANIDVAGAWAARTSAPPDDAW